MKKSLKSGLKVHLEKFKSKKILAQGKGTPLPLDPYPARYGPSGRIS